MSVKTHKKSAVRSQPSNGPGKQFLMASLNMSWQLTLVVLVPILGGFWLDKALGSLPALTFIGFLLAMLGMAVVVWRNMQRYSPTIKKKTRNEDG